MAAIQRHHRSTRRSRERYNGSVCDALAGLAGLVRGKDVMAKLLQALDHGRTEILVRIELGRRLCFCCLLDGLLNRLVMGGIVVPGGCQIRQR